MSFERPNIVLTFILMLRRTLTRRNYSTHINAAKERLNFGNGQVALDKNYAEGIALIKLSNPERHNALSGKMMVDLSEIVMKLGKPEELGELGNDLVGLILWGEGKSFCAGLDLSNAKEHIMTPEAGKDMSLLMQDTLSRLQKLPLVSVAAIEGAALGGGAEVTTATDFRVIAKSDKAHIRFVQTKMGVTPGWGAVSRLLQLVGRQRALDFLTRAPRIDNALAIESGLAVDVAPEGGKALQAATDYLDSVVYFAPKKDGDDTPRKRNNVDAIRGMKRLVSYGSDIEPAAPLGQLEHSIFTSLWGSEANREAVLGKGKK